ncbi:unnamed protein product [Citrullus colocynthis]|uniref:Uncharacterized protein n=1 Tax=Citrullus colocynthis TaxID=252529 RepID=A0ABP0YUX0_9ROSI
MGVIHTTGNQNYLYGCLLIHTCINKSSSATLLLALCKLVKFGAVIEGKNNTVVIDGKFRLSIIGDGSVTVGCTLWANTPFV